MAVVQRGLRWLNTALKGCSSQAETWEVKNIPMKDFNWQVKFDVFVVSMATWTTEFLACTVTQWKIKMQTIQYRRTRIWEMKKDKYTKTLAKNQVCEIFQMRDIGKNGLPKFIKLCMETPCWCPFRNTNMAAGYHQKHLFSSFPTNAWILRLRNS